jgi:L-Lysine epsilon oxidase N-terminal
VPVDLNAIVEAHIHPAIGIARVGNSPEGFFVGPEIPVPTGPPDGGYRDAQGKLKRQAARFRIYGYDSKGAVVGEISADDAEIVWTVRIANKKAGWYDFDMALDLSPEAATVQSARPNAGIPQEKRDQLNIVPEPVTIRGSNRKSAPFLGQFFDRQVNLGELRTDAHGRLLFLGGSRQAGTPFTGFTLNTFANNPAWYDDTSDGPVSATVTIAGRPIPVDPAWVVTAPPNYAPDVIPLVTMYDTIFDAIAGAVIRRSRLRGNRSRIPPWNSTRT